jgi:hypothetical protein
MPVPMPMPLSVMPLSLQFAFLFILGLPVACVAWTVTHEEVFREPREWCRDRSQRCQSLVRRKFFYLFTCEYCFSHYVAAFFLLVTGFQLLYNGWRGYLIAWFALVWVANVYMSFFNRLRLDIKHENVAIAVEQTKVEDQPSATSMRKP